MSTKTATTPIKETFDSALESARDVMDGIIDQVGHAVDEARPVVEDATGKARDHARTFATEKAAPAVATGAALAAQRAQQMEKKAHALEAAAGTVAAAPKRKRRRKKLMLLALAAVVGGVAAYVVRQQKSERDNWRSAMPEPVPADKAVSDRLAEPTADPADPATPTNSTGPAEPRGPQL